MNWKTLVEAAFVTLVSFVIFGVFLLFIFGVVSLNRWYGWSALGLVAFIVITLMVYDRDK